MAETYTARTRSVFGTTTVKGNEEGITSLSIGGTEGVPDLEPHPSLRDALHQLDEYFTGARKAFDLPLRLEGTEFQMRVWEELLRIPYGETRSYGQVAKAIGNPRAARAVGQAVHSNPLSIVVPCHRVIGHDGNLVGYGGPSERGLNMKRWLLDHEAVQSLSRQAPL
jgi:methylated-DNA-[protein]-cysteine S-methyltransferase